MQFIYKYSISILFALCAFNLWAQQSNKEDSIKTQRGILKNIRVELDLVPILSIINSKSETYTYEVAAQANINHKYFPVLEIGFAGANKSALNEINYTTNAIFTRVGMDFNLMKPKPGKTTSHNFFLAGVRLGLSNFNFDYNNITVENNYWKETKTYDLNNQNSTKAWFEIVAGIRVEISPKIYMGWTIRNKNKLGTEILGEINPWYIPGYGINNDSNWGVNYAIGYLF
jgi:hypothetical protein